MTKPTKKTSRTRNLIGKVERMCELLLLEDRTMQELANELCVSKSGARNYMAHLKNAKLIEIVGEKRFGDGPNHEILRIKKDRVAIAAMLKALQEAPPTENLKVRATRSKIDAVRKDKTRHIHKMKDDQPFFPKIASAKPPGRYWLDTALFGSGSAPSISMERNL